MNFLRLIRALLHRLRHVRPGVESYYLLGRRIAAGQSSPPPGYRLALVTRDTDPHFDDLVAFSALQGIDANWCLEELRDGVFMVLAICNKSGRVAGAAWVATRAHAIDPIYHRFDPGPWGSGMLHAFVSPEHRGSRLQRHMVQPRFVRLLAMGKRFAYAVVRCDNRPSLRNYLNDEFVPIVRIDLVRVGGLTLTNFRRLTHALPMGRFIARTWPGSAFLHFARVSKNG